MVALFIYHRWKKIPSERIAFLYEDIITKGEWWRCVSSTFSHLSILHICMNMITLWLMYDNESEFGSGLYLHLTFLLVIGTNACMLAAGWLFTRYKPTWVRFTNGAGYSGILFGWLSIFSMIRPMGTALGALPNFLIPWIYLIATQVLLWNLNISFIGHLSGIIIGYLIMFRVFAWVDWYTSLSLAIILFVSLIFNLKQTSQLSMPWLTISQSTGRRRMQVLDGQLQSIEPM